MNPSEPHRRRPQKKKSHINKFLVTGLLAVAVFVITALMLFGGNFSIGGPMKIRLVTNIGNIIVELRDDRPIITSNFKKLVQEGVYDGTIFYRVVNLPENLVIVQGGDPATSPTWSGENLPSIKDEFSDNNKNERGTVAMANRG